MKKSILIIIVGAFMCGCTWTRPHQIIPSNAIVKGTYKIIGPASGQSCETHLFGMFKMGESSRLQSAIDNALEKSGGDAIIEITTDVTFSTYLIYDKNCVLVNGLAIKR